MKILILLLVSLGLFIFLHTYRPPAENLLWRSITNTGHVPLFGLLSLIFLGLSSLLLKKWIRRRLSHYLTALAAVFISGLGSEAVQMVGPRDADLGDLLLDLAGAFIFLGFYATYDRQLKGFWEGLRSGAYRIILRTVTAVLFAALISPPVIWSIAYIDRSNKFPVICDFESYWDRMFLSAQEADLEVVAAPEGMGNLGGDRVGRITFNPGKYPGLEVIEPYPDWRGHEYLRFEVFSELDSLVNLALVIKDAHHNSEYYDRFNRRLVIRPGSNLIEIPLEEVRDAPRNRRTDMRNIASVQVFMYDISREYVLYLDNFAVR